MGGVVAAAEGALACMPLAGLAGLALTVGVAPLPVWVDAQPGSVNSATVAAAMTTAVKEDGGVRERCDRA